MNEKELLKEERAQFQVDRIAFFSDAIIAIAITLEVLEVKIPPLGSGAHWKDIPERFTTHTWMSLGGMLVCFLAIGNLWIRHHDLYRYVKNYNNRLVRTNLFFLLAIVLLPLTTSFMMDADNPLTITQPIFLLNLAACYLLYFWLLSVAFSPDGKYADIPDAKRLWAMKAHAVRPAIMLAAMAVIAFFGKYSLFWIFPAWPAAEKLWGRWQRRKAVKGRPAAQAGARAASQASSS